MTSILPRLSRKDPREVRIRTSAYIRLTLLGCVLSLSTAACARRAPESRPSLAPPAAAPPAPAPAAAAVWCDTVALHTSGVVRNRLLMLELASADSGQPLPRPDADSLLARVAAALRLPSALALPIYSPPGRLPEDSLERGDSNWVHPSVDALIRVPLTANGQSTPTLLVRTYDAALDSALLQAATLAVGPGASTPAPDVREPPSAQDTTRGLHLSLTLSTPSDSSTRARNRRRMDRGELLERALREVRLRHYPDAKMPEQSRPSRAPRYPQSLMDAGVEGEVLLQGVIGPDGRLVLPSLRVLRTSHAAFVVAVLAAAPHFQYVPGRVAGCPVPMRVQQSFVFAVAN